MAGRSGKRQSQEVMDPSGKKGWGRGALEHGGEAQVVGLVLVVVVVLVQS